jgi:POT family proton-dependent oligopeptide transporter
VTFTDRLLTKDLVPSMVQRIPEVAWSGGPWNRLEVFASTTPWSILSLLLAPGAFMVAATLSDRKADSRAPQILFAASVIVMLVLLVRDCLVLPQTAGSLTFLGALFIVLLAPAFSAVWAWLDRRGWEPSKPVKSAAGLGFAGLAFVPLIMAADQAGASGGMASVWWLVLAYFVLEIGEMSISPIGLSAVTQLSVSSVVSLMMGTWFLATAFSEVLAALFGTLAAIEVPEGENMNIADAAAKYADLFRLLMWIGLGCGAFVLVLTPILRRGMHGVK